MSGITWKALLDKPAPVCALCHKSLKASRLSFVEALYLCQTPGCLFPLDSPHFDDYVVKLASALMDKLGPTPGKRATSSNPNGAGHAVANRKSQPTNQHSGPEPFPLQGFDTEISYADAIDVDPNMLSELLGSSAGDSPALEPATGSCQPNLVSTAAAWLLSDDDDDDDGAVSDGPPSETTDGAAPVSHLVIPVAQIELSYPPGKKAKPDATDRPVHRSVSPPQASVSPSAVMSTNSSIDTVGQSQSVISNAKRTCPETDDSAIDGSASEREEMAAMWDSASDGDEMPAAGDATPTRPSKRPRALCGSALAASAPR